MISYCLQIEIFQLGFLLVYDLFLRKETFFQSNRFYLIGCCVLSLILPGVSFVELGLLVPNNYRVYVPGTWQLDALLITTKSGPVNTFWQNTPWYVILYFSGVMFMTSLFGFKLMQLNKLLKSGTVTNCRDYKIVMIPESRLAFSFFGHVFLGELFSKEKRDQILSHELIHIRQKHSFDLLLLELLRIVFWFNPLVYIYQHRLGELHEFIADTQAQEFSRKERIQLLLSELFQTERTSFVNHFYQKSLIKKRIVMLSKQKSRATATFKFLTIIPLVCGMVFYASCEELSKSTSTEDSATTLVAKEVMIPFAEIDELPIYPGCEEATDVKACFLENIQEHVRKNFNYPKEAQELGIEGRVAVMFVVNTEGEIANIQMRGPHKLLENEVERIIAKIPKMQPGKHQGQTVNMPFSLPVVFKLQ